MNKSVTLEQNDIDRYTITKNGISYTLTLDRIFDACSKMLTPLSPNCLIDYNEPLSSFHRFLIDTLDARHYRLEVAFVASDSDGENDWPSNVEVDLELHSYNDKFGKISLLEEDNDWGVAELDTVLRQIIKQIQEDKCQG